MAKLDIINYKGTPCEIVPEIAPLFKTTEDYSAGDHVIYEAEWYTFKEAKEAGAWDATKVDGPFKVANEIAGLKEDLSNISTEGTVPTSEQMLSNNYTEDSVPYHFRKTVSDNADREELEIVGGSVAWNQMTEHGNFDSSSGWSVNNGQISISDNVATWTTTGRNQNLYRNAIGKKDHVYFLTATIKKSDSIDIYLRYSATNLVTSASTTNWQTLSTIYKRTADDTTSTSFGLVTSASDVAETEVNAKNFMQIDLTQMFGSTIADHIYALEQATAGAGVALVRSLFPKDYYAYDAGSMQSVNGLQSHKTVGFNIIDESKIVTGSLNTSTGNAQSSTDRCITDFTEITSDREYYCRATQSTGVYAFFYDANKTYIGYHAYPLNGTTFIPANLSNAKSGATGNIGDTAVYMRLRYDVGAVYNNTLCVNASDSSLNGQYMPYSGKHSYALDDSLTLRGIPTLVDGKIKFDGDIYLPSGKVTRRYGIVDLGTLNWESLPSGRKQAIVTGLKGAPNHTVGNAICTVYQIDTGINVSSNTNDKTISVGFNNANKVYVYDASRLSDDAATFKTAMSGQYLVYELATPTTEQADPYVSPQICDPNGTEEFVSTGIVPVGHNTKYPDNMRAKLDGLPWNFARLIAPVEKTFKATQNYDMGRRLIVNNVLYIATANIANGANIVVGSNVRETNVDELLAELAQ